MSHTLLQHVRSRALVALVAIIGALLPTAPAPTFAAVDHPTLTVTLPGGGRVTSTPGGIDCPGDCTEDYAGNADEICTYDPEIGQVICEPTWEPTTVQILASPAAGFAFSSWSGGGCASNNPCDIVMDQDITVHANFLDVGDPTVALTSPGDGAAISGAFTAAATATDNWGVASVRFQLVSLITGYSHTSQHDDTSYPFTASFTGTTLPDGAYEVRAQAFDLGGRQSAVSAHAITLDKTPPIVSVAEGPDGSFHASGTTQTWSFSASDATSSVTEVACRVDGAAFGACSGGATSHSVSGLPEGQHSFEVRATDAAGNTSTVGRQFWIDATPPTVQVEGPDGDTFPGGSTQTWTFSAFDTISGLTAFECRLDAADFDPCSDGEFGHTISGAPEGTHTFEVRVTDGVGHQTTVTRSFKIDASAPETTFSTRPGRFLRSRTATFGLTSEPAATFECRLDGGSWAACGAEKRLTGLGSGSHVFRARAIDAVGNRDASPAAWTFTVPDDDASMARSTGWSKLTSSRYFSGRALRTTTKGADLKSDSVKLRSLALLVTKCPGCGKVEVWHGAKLLRTVSLAASTTQHREVVTIASFDTLTTARRVRIEVVSSGKPVTIDGVHLATR